MRLVIPARSRYLRLARLTAAGIAGDLGFSLEAIEDLRVAVDEACADPHRRCRGDGTNGHELEVATASPATLVIEGGSRCGAGEPIDIHPVAHELLEMTADETSIGRSTDGSCVSIGQAATGCVTV